MGADADVAFNASFGERSLERINSRNGYRPRRFDTRVGTMELAIPKLRAGSYFPEWLLEFVVIGRVCNSGAFSLCVGASVEISVSPLPCLSHHTKAIPTPDTEAGVTEGFVRDAGRPWACPCRLSPFLFVIASGVMPENSKGHNVS